MSMSMFLTTSNTTTAPRRALDQKWKGRQVIMTTAIDFGPDAHLSSSTFNLYFLFYFWIAKFNIQIYYGPTRSSFLVKLLFLVPVLYPSFCADSAKYQPYAQPLPTCQPLAESKHDQQRREHLPRHRYCNKK